MAHNFNIMQWNCRSIFARYNEICYILEEEKVDVACLSETCLDNNNPIQFNNFNLIHKARDRRGGGSGILIRKNLDFSIPTNGRLHDLCAQDNVDFTLINLKLNTGISLNIISIYNPPSKSTTCGRPDFWNKFMSLCSRLDNVIICGDFNGHSLV